MSSSFRKLQTAAVGAAEARRLAEKSALADLHTLKDVSAEAFPLFLSTRQVQLAAPAGRHGGGEGLF